MKKFILTCLLLVTLGFTAYLDSPYSFIYKDYVVVTDGAVTVDTEPAEEAETTFLELEKVFVSDEEVDGYLVETYREYEVYKDKNGEVIKTVATSNYDYIRYKINQE